MTLVPSCDTLYFTQEPKDNLITLQVNPDRSPHFSPNTTAIFKVKSSSPQSYHVVPCYGAVLLRDEKGEKPAGYKGGDITFSLIRKDGVIPPASAAADRFCIEYYILQEEPLTYQNLSSSLSNPSQQAQAAKSAWSLVSTSTLARNQVSQRQTIPLSVKVERDSQVLEIPPTAHLVPSRAAARDGTNQSRSARSTATQQSTKTAANDENAETIRGLKGAALSMKHEMQMSAESARQAERSSRLAEKEAAAAAAAAAAEKPSDAPPEGQLRLRHPGGQTSDPKRGTVLAVCPPPSEEETGNVLMTFQDLSRHFTSTGRAGINIFVVILGVVVAFTAALLLRRCTGHMGSVATSTPTVSNA